MRDEFIEVSFKGEALDGLAERLDCDEIVVDRGVTRLRVRRDDAVLHGVLAQLDELGLELLDVRASPAPSTPDDVDRVDR